MSETPELKVGKFNLTDPKNRKVVIIGLGVIMAVIVLYMRSRNANAGTDDGYVDDGYAGGGVIGGGLPGGNTGGGDLSTIQQIQQQIATIQGTIGDLTAGLSDATGNLGKEIDLSYSIDNSTSITATGKNQSTSSGGFSIGGGGGGFNFGLGSSNSSGKSREASLGFTNKDTFTSATKLKNVAETEAARVMDFLTNLTGGYTERQDASGKAREQGVLAAGQFIGKNVVGGVTVKQT